MMVDHVPRTTENDRERVDLAEGLTISPFHEKQSKHFNPIIRVPVNRACTPFGKDSP